MLLFTFIWSGFLSFESWLRDYVNKTGVAFVRSAAKVSDGFSSKISGAEYFRSS